MPISIIIIYYIRGNQYIIFIKRKGKYIMKKREELIEEINNFDRRDINKPEYSIIKEIQFSIPVYDNPCTEEDFSSYVLEWD